jgi:uncharacterized phage-associated protein
MANVNDVAAFILEARGQMTAMKLQKLVYYCQAWSLVWDEKPLFQEKIEAWANGPVVRVLYREHRKEFQVSPPWKKGDPAALDKQERATVLAVLKAYGDKTSQWLSDLTHLERPWIDARQGLPPGAQSTAEITHASMMEYYGGLRAD